MKNPTLPERLRAEAEGMRAVGRYGDHLMAEAADRIEVLEAALRAFAHPDLCKETAGNVRGDDSPVFGRDKATLYLRDFRRARALLEEGK